jgi:hypothetical protein
MENTGKYDTRGNRRKYGMKGKCNDVKCYASTEKIAYYVQGLCKKRVDIGNVILVVKSQFSDNDIKEFADKYYVCSNNDNVRHVANLLRPICSKNIKLG